jgi:hypothetical protein
MRPRDSIAGRAPAPQRTRRLLLVAACLVGCDVADPPVEKLTPEQQFATRAWPALAQCVGCHATQPSIDFLAPGTPEGAYTTVFGFQPPVVDVESPASSLVLTMGKHTGPALVPAAADALLAWLEAEREARVPDGGEPVVIGPTPVVLGAPNTIELGVDGAKLRFVPEAAAGGLSLSQLELVAGPRGLRVVHPLFTSEPAIGDARVDTSDRYGDLDLELAANAVEELGGGAALFYTFPPSDPLTIHFRKLEAP